MATGQTSKVAINAGSMSFSNDLYREINASIQKNGWLDNSNA